MLRQGNHEFEASLSYLVRPCPKKKTTKKAEHLLIMNIDKVVLQYN
jgi:hypothetical protein